ncbi:hypothetical protein [Desulfosporosinus youngiae]|nr:hypothetical protein [Desulfosporosinus youngiae]
MTVSHKAIEGILMGVNLEEIIDKALKMKKVRKKCRKRVYNGEG